MAQCKDEIKAADGSTYFCILEEGHEENDHVFHKNMSRCPLCERTETKPSTAGGMAEITRS